GESCRAYFRRPRPSLRFFDRRDINGDSLTLLSVEHSKDPILGAKVFVVAYKLYKNGRVEKKRVMPAEFEWLKNTKMEGEGEPRHILGEEIFPFLFSRRQQNNLWLAELRAYLLPDDSPFSEWKNDPN